GLTANTVPLTVTRPAARSTSSTSPSFAASVMPGQVTTGSPAFNERRMNAVSVDSTTAAAMPAARSAIGAGGWLGIPKPRPATTTSPGVTRSAKLGTNPAKQCLASSAGSWSSAKLRSSENRTIPSSPLTQSPNFHTRPRSTVELAVDMRLPFPGQQRPRIGDLPGHGRRRDHVRTGQVDVGLPAPRAPRVVLLIGRDGDVTVAQRAQVAPARGAAGGEDGRAALGEQLDETLPRRLRVHRGAARRDVHGHAGGDRMITQHLGRRTQVVEPIACARPDRRLSDTATADVRHRDDVG